jgi:hypothetical protein
MKYTIPVIIAAGKYSVDVIATIDIPAIIIINLSSDIL